MIFVTVGTHEQQFNRLIKAVDDLKSGGVLDEEIIIQTGFSDYEPAKCTFTKFFPYQEMRELVDEARIVITHGGPSSFFMPLQVGKTPIVVPRRKEFREHVNDHQVTFCRLVAERQNNIILLEDTDKLADVIQNYDTMVAGMPAEMKSNNTAFCNDFKKIVEDIFS